MVAWPSSGGVDAERCTHLRGIKAMESRTSLMVQFRLRHQASTAGGMSLIPGWGSKILHATCQKKKKKKEKKKKMWNHQDCDCVGVLGMQCKQKGGAEVSASRSLACPMG